MMHYNAVLNIKLLSNFIFLYKQKDKQSYFITYLHTLISTFFNKHSNFLEIKK